RVDETMSTSVLTTIVRKDGRMMYSRNAAVVIARTNLHPREAIRYRSPHRRARVASAAQSGQHLGSLEVDDQLNFVTAASAGRHALRLCGASSAAKDNITISGATPSPFALRMGPQKHKM